MDKAVLEDLSNRCQNAKGWDQELDADIWWATRSKAAIESFDPFGFVRRCIDRDGSPAKALAQFFDSSNPTCLARISLDTPYTSSIDAAMLLVPNESDTMNVMVLRDDDVWEASVWGSFETQPSGIVASTPALALTAAALQARIVYSDMLEAD